MFTIYVLFMAMQFKKPTTNDHSKKLAFKILDKYLWQWDVITMSLYMTEAQIRVSLCPTEFKRGTNYMYLGTKNYHTIAFYEDFKNTFIKKITGQGLKTQNSLWVSYSNRSVCLCLFGI